MLTFWKKIKLMWKAYVFSHKIFGFIWASGANLVLLEV